MSNNEKPDTSAAIEALKDFGKPSEEKTQKVIESLGLIETLSGQNAVIALEILTSSLYTFIVHCARMKAGVSPHQVVEIVNTTMKNYQDLDEAAEFQKSIQEMVDGDPEKKLVIVDPDAPA